MFRNFFKDKQIVDKYIDSYHIHKNNIFLLRYELSVQNNPKAYLKEVFSKIDPGNVIVITEAIVYDEDAYLNAAASFADPKHRRFYSVNEILEFAKDDAKLNYFLNFTEEVSLEKMFKYLETEEQKQQVINILQDFPEEIKKHLSFKEENGRLVSFSANVAVFIFIKK